MRAVRSSDVGAPGASGGVGSSLTARPLPAIERARLFRPAANQAPAEAQLNKRTVSRRVIVGFVMVFSRLVIRSREVDDWSSEWIADARPVERKRPSAGGLSPQTRQTTAQPPRAVAALRP